MKFLSEPLVHFLFIGVVIYLLYIFFTDPIEKETKDTIIISAGEIEALKSAWEKRWFRLPTNAELEGLIQQYIKETVLYREALAMGLDQNDTIVRRRLAQKLEFLAEDLVSYTPPTEKDLQEYFERNKHRYQEPIRLSFSQIYFDSDKRGDKALKDAADLKQSLQNKKYTTEQINELGDSLMQQHNYSERSIIEIQKLFGNEFGNSLETLTTDQWHGPILSGYGVHLVFVHDRNEPLIPSFADVKELVVRDWETDQRETFNAKYYESLRERYKIIIEEDTIIDNTVAVVPK